MKIHFENQPFSYNDLLSTIKDGSLNVRLKSHSSRLEGKLTFNKKNSVFVLVDGGWLPLFLLDYPVNLLLDSNFIAMLNSKNYNSNRDIAQESAWVLNFATPNILFNPLPYVLEGDSIKTPSQQEIKERFSKATEIIETTIPDAKVIHYNEEQFEKAHELISDMTERNKKEFEFLYRAVPLIANHISKDKLLSVQGVIYQIAKESDIDITSSLPFLAVLSCLYEGGQSRFPSAKRVLKPNAIYTQEDAANAMGDLNGIKFLLVSQALNKRDDNPMSCGFCTLDKALALLWCGFRFDTSDSKEFKYSLGKDLFARLDDENRKSLISSFHTF